MMSKIELSQQKGAKYTMAKEENRIIVEHVYKTFNVYMDKANSLKEKILFWKRNRKFCT